MAGPDEKQINNVTKDYQKEQGNKPDSDRDFERAGHQARNDYQRSGSPFGPLSNRDITTKKDVDDKR